jgi:hypothetical protein
MAVGVFAVHSFTRCLTRPLQARAFLAVRSPMGRANGRDALTALLVLQQYGSEPADGEGWSLQIAKGVTTPDGCGCTYVRTYVRTMHGTYMWSCTFGLLDHTCDLG